MNEIYVFWAEVNAGMIRKKLILGLVRIREILSLDASIQPGRVLIHAYEALELHIQESTQHIFSTRSTETIIKDVKKLRTSSSTHHTEEDHSVIEMDSKDEELILNRGIDLLMGQMSRD